MSRAPAIAIVGLGSGDPGDRSVSGQRALDNATSIVLLTTTGHIPPDLANDSRVVVRDNIAGEAIGGSEDTVGLSPEFIAEIRSNSIVFAVPGPFLVTSLLVHKLVDAAEKGGLNIVVLPAASPVEAVLARSGIDPLVDQPQFIEARQLAASVDTEQFSGSQVAIDPTRTLVITSPSHHVEQVTKGLLRLYPASHHILGVPADAATSAEASPLDELEISNVYGISALVVPPLDWLEASRSPATLFRIIGQLRSPDGCPWDREQTHESLSDKVLEEAYEVADAIASGDPYELRDELGDLLLLVALHAQIAEENGAFTIEEVFASVNQKLVRRHPHVFGDEAAATADEVLNTWKRVKAAEWAETGAERPALRYDQLPRSMSVIGRIRRAEGGGQQDADEASHDLGRRLLDLVFEALDKGVDPEPALESAYRAMRQKSIGIEETS